tara:strand:+ start:48 stop:563 length:516 start_codon:yes stop_codon:yes gene_type:complete
MELPKGLKMTSSLITISEGLTESAANTFTSEKVDLQLNPLDNEVFVVYAINIDSRPPDLVTNTKTQTQASVSTTARTDVGSIANNNVMASQTIECINVEDTVASFYEFSAGDTPSSLLPYVGIIATNDFFINLQGAGNNAAKVTAVRVYGVRARAESSIYAALVQSELLSA